MADARQLDLQLLPPRPAVQEPPEADLEESASGAIRSFGGEQPPAGRWSLRSVFFLWVFPLLRRAADVERLEPSDLFALPAQGQPEALYGAFFAEWRRRLAAVPEGQRRRRRGRLLLAVVLRVQWPRMRIFWLGHLAAMVLEFSFPFFLNRLTAFVEDDQSPSWYGFVLAGLCLLTQLLAVVISANVQLSGRYLGLSIRSSMVSAIFRKVLILRQDALLDFSTGRLNNLITTDVDKAKDCIKQIHRLILAPITIVIALVSLYHLVGLSIFIALGYMGLVIVVNPPMMMLESRLTDRQQSKTDERVRKATEVISSINMVKCYAWEERATVAVGEARRAELLALWRLYLIDTVFEALWFSVVPITTAVMFTAYAMLHPDTPLTPAQAFTAMSLLGMLQTPLFALPWTFSLIVDALVACKRLERLFFLAEVRLPATASIGSFCVPEEPADASAGDGPLPADAAVHFQGETFQWPRSRRRSGAEDDEEPAEDDAEVEEAAEADGDGDGAASSLSVSGTASSSSSGDAASSSSGGDAARDGELPEGVASQFQLRGIRLLVPRGALVVVVGKSGSGKSSLLQAILGEMPLAGGAAPSAAAMRWEKSIAFAPATPWVFNATVRQNILFGEPYVEKRYADCVRCCDLEKDFALLKSGDQTKVGEKGISLSGGQKARVCLARAVYRQHASSMFLLDDPYSALDAHVARKVHEEAVLGLLARRTRIVATNRMEFVRGCDLVVVLSEGKIEAMGSYEEVRSRSQVFQHLLEDHNPEAGRAKAEGCVEPAAAPTLVRGLSRATSGGSAVSGEESAASTDGAEAHSEEQEEQEARAVGMIKKEVVLYYLESMGGPAAVSLLAVLYLVAELLNLALPVWLARWTSSAATGEGISQFVSVYVWLSAFVVVFMAVRNQTANQLAFRAAKRLHAAMFAGVLRAPMSFFQDTPQGRIINRFSKDISEIDKEIIWQLIFTIVPVLTVLGNFALVGATAYAALLVFLPALWLYYKCWKFYNKAAIDLKRMEKVMGSPVYDHFNNLCRENAGSIVRAHQQVEHQCRLNNGFLSQQQRSQYSKTYVELWFSLCVEMMGCILVFLVAAFVAIGRGRLISASAAALALTFAEECSGSLQEFIEQLAEFGTAFNCVERVMEYATALPSEAALVTSRRPPPGWPSAGALRVTELRLRYKPELPLVLKGISFSTIAGERVGVVGRTGAGKSSLLLALLRITEPEEGSLLHLDGEDLLALGLQDLRSGITIIPQEPVLFQETLRYNCDPYGQHSAEAIWAALEDAQVAPKLREYAEANGVAGAAGASSGTTSASRSSVEAVLRWQLKEGGQNLSDGERQMVTIARAVLRGSGLVVLDEATAAVDSATDAQIQRAVRRCFKGATTLTIAHRLQTILDSDRVLVLAAGEVVELGPPAELRGIEGGVFRGMVEEAHL